MSIESTSRVWCYSAIADSTMSAVFIFELKNVFTRDYLLLAHLAEEVHHTSEHDEQNTTTGS